ncbi:hypothetical protein [Chryseobacterium sp. MYb328]|uniref:hypothetical protein n=1 Tax=Chryseobacterium sp. MYb328 TaxID=2745231 RepID=UPI0030A87B7D
MDGIINQKLLDLNLFKLISDEFVLILYKTNNRKLDLLKKSADLIITRIKKISSAHEPQWGTMTASEMLLHCNSCNRKILEESRGNKKTQIKQYL